MSPKLIWQFERSGIALNKEPPGTASKLVEVLLASIGPSNCNRARARCFPKTDSQDLLVAAEIAVACCLKCCKSLTSTANSNRRANRIARTITPDKLQLEPLAYRFRSIDQKSDRFSLVGNDEVRAAVAVRVDRPQCPSDVISVQVLTTDRIANRIECTISLPLEYLHRLGIRGSIFSRVRIDVTVCHDKFKPSIMIQVNCLGTEAYRRQGRRVEV